MHFNVLQIAPDSNDKLRSIFKVPTGKSCNCFCPICEEPLIAKNKNKTSNESLLFGQKLAHFAHANNSDCPGALESAIHLLAKEVLNETKTLMLPPLSYGGIKLNKKQFLLFDKSKVEKRRDLKKNWIQPDVILFKDKKPLFIEFYKTHLVDDEKIEKIKNINISCLEIDINHIDPLNNGELNKDGIRKLLERENIYKNWLHNSKTKDLYTKKLVEISESKAKETEQSKRENLEIRRKQKIMQEEYEAEKKEEERIQELKWEKEEKAYKESLNKHLNRLANWKKEKIDEGKKLLKVYLNGETGFDIPIVYCPERRSLREEEIRMKYANCGKCLYNHGFVGYDEDDRIEVLFACGFAHKVMNQEAPFTKPNTQPPKRIDFNGIFDDPELDDKHGFFDNYNKF